MPISGHGNAEPPAKHRGLLRSRTGLLVKFYKQEAPPEPGFVFDNIRAKALE
jgi:hypothetical protein